MNSPEQLPYLIGDDDAAREQFRSVQMQCFNWGTFTGVLTVPTAPKGFLYVGPSGSGKSTVLDAHATLITPPRYLDFNVAARESEPGSRDRNLLSYVRGAYGQSTGDEKIIVQYLRKNTTWSALAETFRNQNGRVVVLAQVLWVRGASTANADVKRQYMVLEREFDVRELASFAESDFDVRKLKAKFDGDFIREEFSAYEDRFRHHFNIENQRALRLLHKTQSAKSLGDLTSFLRDFMLDPPDTFKIADSLVAQFTQLNDAHQAVLTAGAQIETLKPARDEHQQREETGKSVSLLKELHAGIDPFREQEKKHLLDDFIAEEQTSIRATTDTLTAKTRILDNEQAKLLELEERRRGAGGGRLEQLNRDKEAAETERPQRTAKRDAVHEACRVLGWTPPDNPNAFAELTEKARGVVQAAQEFRASQKTRTAELEVQRAADEKRFASLVAEIRSMERQPSNIPGHYLDVREALARGIGVAPEKLPFAGELLQVRETEAEWQGAIERVLGGFGINILVEDRYYADFSAFLNSTNTGQHVFFQRIQPAAAGGRPAQQAGPKSMTRKIEVAKHSLQEWLRDQLRNHFDYDCADSPSELRGATRGITREGLVKHGSARHEKNDRYDVNNRSRWVLGFDNTAKRKHYEEEARQLAVVIERTKTDLADISKQDDTHYAHAMKAQLLQNANWQEIDVGALLTRITDLEQRISAEKAARPDLDRIDADIVAQKSAVTKANSAKETAGLDLADHQRSVERATKTLSQLKVELLSIRLTPTQVDGMKTRIAAQGKVMGLNNIADILLDVSRDIGEELRGAEAKMLSLQTSMERRFADFMRKWPLDAEGLDATLASATDFFNRLSKLELDGLPRFEAKFRELLRRQSDQELAQLHSRLGDERDEMKGRLDLVNEGLELVPFNTGTRLRIEYKDLRRPEVRELDTIIRGVLTQTFDDNDIVKMEERFKVLKELVRRLSSQETVDRNWRLLVLDVRLHYEFIAREMDLDGNEIEVYASSSGKSGGQRQKLTATCLAAALRYQLSGQGRSLPMFSTIYLDEAFDKADPAFTRLAMTIFTSFGFQMIVATPLKSVMTLEPFIGGACFVECPDRKNSKVHLIEYDEEKRALNLDKKADAAQEFAVS